MYAHLHATRTPALRTQTIISSSCYTQQPFPLPIGRGPQQFRRGIKGNAVSHGDFGEGGCRPQLESSQGSRGPIPGPAGSCGFAAQSSLDTGCSLAHCLPLWSSSLCRLSPLQTGLGQDTAWNSHAGCLEKEEAQESIAWPRGGLCQTSQRCSAEGQRCQD